MIVQFVGGPLDGEQRDLAYQIAIIDYRDFSGLTYRYQLLPMPEGSDYYFWHAFREEDSHETTV